MKLTKQQKKEAGLKSDKPGKFSSKNSKRGLWGDVAHDAKVLKDKAKYYYRHNKDAKPMARIATTAAGALLAPAAAAAGPTGIAALGAAQGLAQNEITKDDQRDRARKQKRQQTKRMYKAYLARKTEGNALPN